MSEYERWEARYAMPDYAFGKAPNYFLQSCKPLLPQSGRALAVADGEGVLHGDAGVGEGFEPLPHEAASVVAIHDVGEQMGEIDGVAHDGPPGL